jgi:hypothetical protein
MNNTAYLWETERVVVDGTYTQLYMDHMRVLDTALILMIFILLFGLVSIMILPKYTFLIFALVGFGFGMVLSFIFVSKAPAIYFILLGVVSLMLQENENYKKRLEK